MYVTPETEGKFGHRPKYWEDIPEFFKLEKRVEDKARDPETHSPCALCAVGQHGMATCGIQSR